MTYRPSGWRIIWKDHVVFTKRMSKPIMTFKLGIAGILWSVLMPVGMEKSVIMHFIIGIVKISN